MEDGAVKTGVDSWPEPVNVLADNEVLVRLTGLPSSLKQKAWAEIKSTSPALAELLKEPLLREIVDRFSAEIFVEAQYAPSLPHERLKGRES